MSDAERLKRRAAERAVGFVASGMRLGLGTGSTARHVVDVLGEKLAAAELTNLVGVPTSRATQAYAAERGIPLSTLDDTPRLDVCIDGADEFDPALDLIKGLGGALLWEKIVASAAERLVIVVDQGKRVARLGTKAPLPVEVVPFGWKSHLDFFRGLGAEPKLRSSDDDAAFVTDGGHYIVDLTFPDGIPAAPELERMLQQRTGIVASGLFVGMTSAVVVAAPEGTEVLEA